MHLIIDASQAYNTICKHIILYTCIYYWMPNPNRSITFVLRSLRSRITGPLSSRPRYTRIEIKNFERYFAMEMFDRSQVLKLLDERKADKPCHRCGHESFSLLDEGTNIYLKKSIDNAQIVGGPSVPVAIAVCNNCGAVTFHAIGALGLLSAQDKAETHE